MEFIDEDFLLALELQEQLDKESWHPSQSPSKPSSQPSSKPSGNLSIVDESWEYLDPNPDIRELFLQFNEEFFWGRLAGIEVKWSPRMTLCAGLCVYEGRGGLCSVRLSQPLLKLRPRRDLVETLLHEMIHAYLFVTDNNKDHDGHGPEFHKHMYRINNQTGTKISVYHNFHDEVDNYRQHWWRCNGPCQTRKPFYGYVKRAMNRAPSERDPWWKDHKKMCNGTFVKIKEPEGYGKKKSKGKDETDASQKKDKSQNETKTKNPDIRSFLGKGYSLNSEKTQQRVVINGVLTNKTDKSDNISKPSTSSNKIDKSDIKSYPSTSTCYVDSSSDDENISLKTKTSVSAIKTSGKISDKELQRQKKLAELVFSDSDDDDLLLCDGPQTHSTADVQGISSSQATSRESNTSHSSTNVEGISTQGIPNKSNYNDSITVDGGHSAHKNINLSFIHSMSVEKESDISDCLNSNEKDTAIQNRNINDSDRQTSAVVNDVALKVRNIWANKQFLLTGKPLDYKELSTNLTSKVNSNDKTNKKLSSGSNIHGHSYKRLSSDDLSGHNKKIKTESRSESKINGIFPKISQQNESSDSSLATCPVCNKSVSASQINSHLDVCLGLT